MLVTRRISTTFNQCMQLPDGALCYHKITQHRYYRITGVSDFIHLPDFNNYKKNNKHDVSETGSVSVLRWGETPILLGPLDWTTLSGTLSYINTWDQVESMRANKKKCNKNFSKARTCVDLIVTIFLYTATICARLTVWIEILNVTSHYLVASSRTLLRG
jgi:hypothetical protein